MTLVCSPAVKDYYELGCHGHCDAVNTGIMSLIETTYIIEYLFLGNLIRHNVSVSAGQYIVLPMDIFNEFNTTIFWFKNTVGEEIPFVLEDPALGEDRAFYKFRIQTRISVCGGPDLAQIDPPVQVVGGCPGGMAVVAEVSVDTQAFNCMIIPVDARTGSINITPPIAPQPNDRFTVADSRGVAENNSIIVLTAADKIFGQSENYEINTNGAAITLVYISTAVGWALTN